VLPQTLQKVASILKSLADSNTLVVASSDFTHYGPNYGYIPFDQNIPMGLKSSIWARTITSQSWIVPVLTSIAIRQARLSAAGYQSHASFDASARNQAGMFKYATSGELTGDFTNSVSYFSIAFHGNWQKQITVEPAKTDTSLTQEDHKKLLLLARRTLEFYLQNEGVISPEELEVPVSEAMKIRRAAFVTLKKNSDLRGCVGEIFPSQSLYKSVIVNAINAAVNDGRFTPVTKDELSSIKIEISALTVRSLLFHTI